MASNVELKFKKCQYNENIDNQEGLIVFDTLLNEIKLGGKDYGPLAPFKPSNIISESSTNQQIATAKGVYDAIQSAVAQMYDKLKGGNGTTNIGGPAKVPAPAVYVDNTSTDAVISTLQANSVYIFNNPLDSLILETVIDSALETTIYFNTGSNGIDFEVPQGMYKVNDFLFAPDKSYCMSIKNKVIVSDELVTYIKSDTMLFGSTQLEGGYIDSPTVYEISGMNPVINNVQPNAVYKLDTCMSITLNNIPSNTLETLIYWTATSSTTLYLSGDSQTTLKITAGSDLVYSNAMYVMSIKDGVIIITKLSSI